MTENSKKCDISIQCISFNSIVIYQFWIVHKVHSGREVLDKSLTAVYKLKVDWHNYYALSQCIINPIGMTVDKYALKLLMHNFQEWVLIVNAENKFLLHFYNSYAKRFLIEVHKRFGSYAQCTGSVHDVANLPCQHE